MSVVVVVVVVVVMVVVVMTVVVVVVLDRGAVFKTKNASSQTQTSFDCFGSARLAEQGRAFQQNSIFTVEEADRHACCCSPCSEPSLYCFWCCRQRVAQLAA